jgi:hypothetical protein
MDGFAHDRRASFAYATECGTVPTTLPLLSTANVRVRQFRRKESDAGPAWFFGQTLERRASNHSVPALYLSIVRLKSDS